MKRKSLTTAILAGLTGVAGMAGVANAVNLNPDGLGQVLLYPYYTAREGNDTMISVVNTTNTVKAVKVRFLEAINSREVLDFNLYLSPYDVWTAAVTELDGGVPGIRTSDTSCTTPYFYDEDAGYGEQEFLNYQYASSSRADNGPGDIGRAASGYVELIEMGTVRNILDSDGEVDVPLAAWATHGPNFNCDALTSMWGSLWAADNEAGISGATGGLFGTGTILNVDEGTMISYNADAIDGFWAEGDYNHTDPGNLFPGLGSGDTESFVFDNGVLKAHTWSVGRNAVDAIFMYDKLFNEYVVDPGLNANSEWVLTFPTKRYHTDNMPTGGPAAGPGDLPPFTSPWAVAVGQTTYFGMACEELDYAFWDRDETPGDTTDIIVSPKPDQASFELCNEANVIRFSNKAGTPDHTEILKEVRRENVPQVPVNYSGMSYVNFDLSSASFTEGWLRFDLGGQSGREIVSNEDAVYTGLPVIGFWAQTYQNGALSGGVLSNYGGAYRHHGSRKIED